jgi:hypothetical protein
LPIFSVWAVFTLTTWGKYCFDKAPLFCFYRFYLDSIYKGVLII